MFKGRFLAVEPLRRSSFLRAAPLVAIFLSRIFVTFLVHDAMVRVPYKTKNDKSSPRI